MSSGGYRANSGPQKGARYVKAGASGAKKKKKTKKDIPEDIKQDAKAENLSPLEYMLKVMNDPLIDESRRDRMSIAAAPFVHDRAGAGMGKKDEKDGKAKKAGKGKFAPSSPPKLKVAK